MTYETEITTPRGHTFTHHDNIENTVDFIYRLVECYENADRLTEQGLKPEFKNALWSLYKDHEYYLLEYSVENGERILNYKTEYADPMG